MNKYFVAASNAAVAFLAYHYLGWIGIVTFAVYEATLTATDFKSNQETIKKILQTRLADRCTFCKREILDEGGVFDLNGIYHDACAEKLSALEELRKEAGVPKSESLHLPQRRYRD